MTAIGYISPQNVPALTADTMIGRSGYSRYSTVLPLGVGISKRADEAQPLARKLYILSDKTVVALAGSADKIHDFLKTASSLVRPLENMDRPMRYLGDLANDIKDV